MSSADFSKHLKAMGSVWNEVKVTPEVTEIPGFRQIPDGPYVFVLVNAHITQSKGESKRFQVEWVYMIESGEYKGEQLRDFDGLDSRENLLWLGKKLGRYGYDVSQIDLAKDLPTILEQLADGQPKLAGRVVNKGQNRNVYIDEVLEVETAKPGAEAAEEGSDEADPTALAEGMKVQYVQKGKSLEGVIEKILNDGAVVQVRGENGKVAQVPSDAIVIVDAEKD